MVDAMYYSTRDRIEGALDVGGLRPAVHSVPHCSTIDPAFTLAVMHGLPCCLFLSGSLGLQYCVPISMAMKRPAAGCCSERPTCVR